MTIDNHSALRLSPRRSPRPALRRSSTTGSATRLSRDEHSLILEHVVGITATRSNAFAYCESTASIAYTAGAAVVVAKLTNNSQLEQRCFRAKPQPPPTNNTSPPIYESSTPSFTSHGLRNRTAQSLRDRGAGSQLYGSPLNDSFQSPGGKNIGTRAKAAACVALSPDGRLLAVGETGHKPRVLLFSTQKNAQPDGPLTIISEHTFGVAHVAFSPDSKYLATLGEANDGFLYVWNVNSRNGAATLHASNKCTTSIRQMAWVGDNLVTVGTRHVKVWRVDEVPRSLTNRRSSDSSITLGSPSNRALPGRNCLLGDLLDRTFTAVVASTPHCAFVSTNGGEICTLYTEESAPSLAKVSSVGANVTSLQVESRQGRLLLGDENGRIQTCPLELLSHSKNASGLGVEWRVRHGSTAEQYSSCPIVATVSFEDNRLVILDQFGRIRIISGNQQVSDDGTPDAEVCYESHRSGILGLQAVPRAQNDNGPAFLVWSADGLVSTWNFDGSRISRRQIPLRQTGSSTDDFQNEIKAFRVVQDSLAYISGDRLGVLRIGNLLDQTSCHEEVKAHTAEVTDLASSTSDGLTLVASSGRDRTVQVLSWQAQTEHRLAGRIEILQTLDEHVSAVTGVAFAADGGKLVSMSSDRTIVVRIAIKMPDRPTPVFVPFRTIMLKTTPLAMSVAGPSNDTLLVSTIDRHVLTFDLVSGERMGGFRTSELEGGESIVLSSLTSIPLDSKSMLIAGGSSTDKSVRLYDTTGRLLARDYGHTESLTGAIVITKPEDSSRKTLVTTASDGTIFMWRLSGEQRSTGGVTENGTACEITQRNGSFQLDQAPIRRILPASELARLRALAVDADGPAVVVEPRTPRRHAAQPTSTQIQTQTPTQAQTQTPQRDDAKHLAVPSTPPGQKSATPSHARRLSVRPAASSPTPRHAKRMQASGGTVETATMRETTMAPTAPARQTTITIHEDKNQGEHATLASEMRDACATLRTCRERLAIAKQADAAGLATEADVLVLRREIGAWSAWLACLPSGITAEVKAEATGLVNGAAAGTASTSTDDPPSTAPAP